jgi:hypothetical protein
MSKNPVIFKLLVVRDLAPKALKIVDFRSRWNSLGAR